MVDCVKDEMDAYSWVTPEGMLNDHYITSREQLYKGMNGRYVERFTVPTGGSYIFKPLTNPAQHGRERWMYERVMSGLPPIYPQLVATSDPTTAPAQSWMIYEDLGQLVHDSQEVTMLNTAVHMAMWHALPVTEWSELPRVGQKPSIRTMLDELQMHIQSVDDLLSTLDMRLSSSDWNMIAALILTAEEELPTVLCHGDLHPGNLAEVDGRLVVLDWEHAHLNTPLWDMYHLVDLSHPLFPRTVTPALRERVIDIYLDKLESLGVQIERDSLAAWYNAYAIVFSLWMLRLIDGDLRSEECVWPKEQLNNQWLETTATLEQCMKQMREE
ncbi:aminoglycoside phosphotransferase family protein [Paenibacillus sp. FSL R5-0749]|uniref:phosphotransferase family protein n=1 Tax=Paenibacillus sp. FSL R5-0749 TaxID=2921657 RepID=UPI00315A040F